jgi:hypothetical protein
MADVETWRKQANQRGRGAMQESKWFPARRTVQAGDAEQAAVQNYFTMADI